MKIWLLRPVAVDKLPGCNPWLPWYDKAFGFVVRAESEELARKFAHAEAGAENHYGLIYPNAKTDCPWLDPAYSTCEELLSDGDAGVILRDLWSA
jgi:hypothetical protein